MRITLPTDPVQRADLLCARSQCRKELTESGIRERDPFCCSTCCRLFHGIEIPTGTGGPNVRTRAYTSKA